MDGGVLPWRTQHVINNSPDIAEASAKSLPPPPSGYFWERCETGEWILLEVPKAFIDDGCVKFDKPSIVEHTVMHGDTLQGICLRYRVSATDLRRANMFSGNNIHFKTSLLIPINAGAIVKPQFETHDVLLQRFKNLTSERTEEARLYLNEHEWNLEQALKSWKNDQQWEGEHPPVDMKVFSTDLPAEDLVFPVKVEIPSQVKPAKISLVPPMFNDMFRRGKHGTTSEILEDPAAEPFL